MGHSLPDLKGHVKYIKLSMLLLTASTSLLRVRIHITSCSSTSGYSRLHLRVKQSNRAG